MTMADFDDLADDEIWQRLIARGVSADQAAWVLNNRDEPEAMAYVARVVAP